MKLTEEFCEKCNKPLVSLSHRPKSFPCICSKCFEKIGGRI
jgi:hypothetical protein